MTMCRPIVFLVFAVLCGGIGQINGQICEPDPVQFLNMHSNGTLTWTIIPEEQCTIKSFIVTLQRAFLSEILHNFETVEPAINLAFLPSCELWVFNVLAVSENYVSRSHYFRGRIPLFPGTDLSLNISRIEQLDQGVRLGWEFTNPASAPCADSYRITVVGENTEIAFDRFSEENSLVIREAASCAEYSFSVRALHASNPYTEGPLATTIYDVPPKRQAAPEMTNIIRGSTVVNTTWHLQGFLTNRCIVYNVQVDGSPFFNVTYPVQDTPYRPPFQINLSSLQPNTFYSFSVSVQNSAGWSEKQTVAIQTLPATGEISSVSADSPSVDVEILTGENN